MVNLMERKHPTSPMRLLEMLSDRFGAFEAVAYSTIKLARFVSQDELSMDLLVAQPRVIGPIPQGSGSSHAD